MTTVQAQNGHIHTDSAKVNPTKARCARLNKTCYNFYMPSAFLRTFRKLHLYVHKTVQKHGITNILSYINIPTFRITTRFSLAKTFSRQLSLNQMNCGKKHEMFSRFQFIWGSGVSNKTKTSKQFLPIIFGIHAKNCCLPNSRLGVVRIYVH